MSENTNGNLPIGTRILAAMSGGVDSSVAAYRLAQAGFDVVGVTMHLIPCGEMAESAARDDTGSCCSPEAAEDARRTAEQIGIPHYTLNLAEIFREKVIEPAKREYARGRTPNPCVLCNRFMKFDVLFQKAEQLGCTHIATGHYASITLDSSGWHLHRGIDPDKDQSYFLAFLTEKELSRILFPLGGDTKKSIRRAASEIGLSAADRPESQDLCFLANPPDEYRINGPEAGKSGEIVTTDGKVIGKHAGIAGFTIGQRKGIGGGMPKRMYVVDIDPESGKVTIGLDSECLSYVFSVEDVSLVSWERERVRFGSEVGVQVRYRTKPVMGKVEISDDGDGKIRLMEPVRAIAPGQAAVFYDGDEVLGAGTIRDVER